MSIITSKKVSWLNGSDIFLFRITNSSGAYVEVTNYGATLVSVVVPDRYGNLGNIVLNYNNVEGYFADTCYLGSTIGRVANRISGARFMLNGKCFDLDKNDGPNSNHGGFSGFNTKVMNYTIGEEQVIFLGSSPDGEGGFPGNVRFSIAYGFSEENELLIEYAATSDAETPLNLTNHAYFNLSSAGGDILNHELRSFADEYLEMNDEFLPTGNILPVVNTAFDFRQYSKIARMMPFKKDILKGYNAYYISRESGNKQLKIIASLREIDSGRKMDVYSTMPGVQFYTGDYLGGKHRPFSGLCLEAQYFPDFPNHSHFPACIIGPEKKFKEQIKFVFSIEA